MRFIISLPLPLAILCASTCIGLRPGGASAQVPVDSRGTESVVIEAGSGFIASLKRNNSYCCTVYPTSPATTAGLSATLEREGDPDSTASGALRGSMEPAVPIAASFADTDAADNRVCAIPPQSGNYRFPIASAQAGGEAVRVSCDNTTLNGGFNTNATPFNFLECTNVADAAVAARVFAVDFAGQTLINGTSVTLQPGLRTDLDVHTAVGPDRFGRLFVVHDGTKQAIRCVVSRYDLDLTLRSSLPLE